MCFLAAAQARNSGGPNGGAASALRHLDRQADVRCLTDKGRQKISANTDSPHSAFLFFDHRIDMNIGRSTVLTRSVKSAVFETHDN
jgi:hypothetical protein